MKYLITVLFIFLSLVRGEAQTSYSPDWTKDLIIYEISAKNFTSPKGPGTGTFKSTMERIPYLSDLGINAVWFSGHNWADKGHFYGIWTQYATMRPDSIDPSLGTRKDLKSMTDAFHKKGIKVFLDIITHGVMNESPLVKEHPEWFKGGSWGMTDYDWNGNHKDLDKWWVKTHVDYVLNQGIDGYRLDVDIYRPNLWKEIKKQCANAGHPIAVFLENRLDHANVCDFYQKNLTISNQMIGVDSALAITTNTALYFKNYVEAKDDYTVKVNYHDGTINVGSSLNGGEIEVKKVYQPIIQASNNKNDYKGKYIDLLLENLDTNKYITSISVKGKYFNKSVRYHLENSTEFDMFTKQGKSMHIYLKPINPDIINTSIQLSAHDDGWDKFPAEDNPYVAEGSRCLFGYSFLFTPAIPIFMGGDEFDAKFIPHPDLTPDLYGKGVPGKGTWLYGSVIDWSQIKQNKHKEMLNDVKKMIAIRKSEKDIFHSYSNNDFADLFSLEFNCDEKIPVPFAIQNKDKIIIVVGNNTSNEVKCTVKIPLIQTGILADKTYTVMDLWNNKKWKVKGNELNDFSFTIRKDKSAKGGIAVFKIIK